MIPTVIEQVSIIGSSGNFVAVVFDSLDENTRLKVSEVWGNTPTCFFERAKQGVNTFSIVSYSENFTLQTASIVTSFILKNKALFFTVSCSDGSNLVSTPKDVQEHYFGRMEFF